MNKTTRWAVLVASLAASGFACTSCARHGPPAFLRLPPGISAAFTEDELKTNRKFQAVFCSVLGERDSTSENWESCNQYVEMPQALPGEEPPKLSTDFTLLSVGGFGAECFSPTVEVFKDALEHLQSIHGVTYYHIPVHAFGSTEHNAEIIRDTVKALSEKRFIAVAHSKGAADFMYALSNFPSELKRVEALITVAGAVGGSWLADDFVKLQDTMLRGLKMKGCPQDTPSPQNALNSMRRDRRQEFLASATRNWNGYSISAVSRKERTSDVLLPLWNAVAPHAVEQDSHIVEREAIVPGGRFLGRALGDHWAVAMPFTPNDKITGVGRDFVNEHVEWNRFPRVA